MKRQTQVVATRVYQYGTVPARVAPVLNEDLAMQQLRLAHRLWNTLVAIHQAHTTRYQRIMRDDRQARIEELRQQAATLRDELKARRKQGRTRQVPTDDITTPLGAIKADLAALIEASKADAPARRAAKRAELDAAQVATNRRIRKAQQAAGRMGLYWCTGEEIVERADRGRKLGKLQFRRWQPEGTLTARIVGGAPTPACVGGSHGFIRVEAPGVRPEAVRAEAPRQKWTYAHIRIGSNPDRSPIFLSIPIVYHRPIPADGLIKFASMTLQGGRWRLNVCVTTAPVPVKTTGRQVAIDIGWRLTDDGVRVAAWHDTTGHHGQVVVPYRDLAALDKVRDLRSICDTARDEFLPSLCGWFESKQLPQEWQDRTRALAQWRSTDRLADLVLWWDSNRLPDDDEIFTEAVAWRKQYLHLANWWRNQEEQIRLRIRERYRVFGAAVAKEYRTVYLEDFDLREVAELPSPESSAVRTASSTYRQMVSPSVFRAALINAAKREGLRVEVLPAEWTTKTCHACGHMDEWDQAAQVMHTCSRCNATWDQDANAAINLLQLGIARDGGDWRPGMTDFGGLSQTPPQVVGLQPPIR